MSVKYALYCKGITPFDADLPYIEYVLKTIQHAQRALAPEYELYKEVPFVVVDKGVLKDD
ncbi:hypothetical protein [Mesobacillus subterraneus]|uniref:Uncharacterized protein n=1 Tax=Mesobacillus subterraneus TaxID=285983 RepID=A0A3R9FKN4_9BACI|nr:hypothetical protein [Mesobacillus subterraneus]RSD28628.1 hypothetical protein EJA10_03370 [Mesobacillus subterraneus]